MLLLQVREFTSLVQKEETKGEEKKKIGKKGRNQNKRIRKSEGCEGIDKEKKEKNK